MFMDPEYEFIRLGVTFHRVCSREGCELGFEYSSSNSRPQGPANEVLEATPGSWAVCANDM